MATALAFIFVLGVLVFVHEFGHFIVARLCGVRVEKFSLGFPPKMFGKKIGETEYIISWLPLGGYVKLAGENPGESTGENPWEFMAKPPWKRALVIAAGPIMNLLLAVVFFWGILFATGQETFHYETAEIGHVAAEGPAQRAGIQPGDLILEIDRAPVADFNQMAELIFKKVEVPVVVKWQREGEVFEQEIVTMREQAYDESKQKVIDVGKIGVGPLSTHHDLNIFQAFWGGITVTAGLLGEVVKVLIGLFSGTMSIKMLGGPVFIAQAAGQTAQMGFVALLSFTALLSLNLAFINLLPIPVLDGGHLLFLAIEKIRGKPLSVKQRTVAQQIGFGFLVILILFITYNDIFRLLGK
ncbi:MAG: RIP metalloprotease RseP [candidate division Zixibacteria bacterium]|nr:RIP metalloprotease RseP [candidate division Zixibacteria bacterium]